ncbi:11943_t:CDS:2 [Diversispora eburnea]|uniref:11943_t:CDS:1 n=1 Tax=Diversispora eburnea TaxID=1213867 RepID=A0A9N8ZTD9_9GLOM|nr:11943_t:CDS:2 [Diversispora eburnea]
MPKATLDSLWGSLEGKFNKFVAGDTLEENGNKSSDNQEESVGPFSHFSAISQPTSGNPSRSASSIDFRSNNDQRSNTPKTSYELQRRSSTPGSNSQSVSTINTGNIMNTGNGYYSSPTTSDGYNTSMPMVPEGQPSYYLTSSITDDNNNNYYGVQNDGQENYNSYGYNTWKPTRTNTFGQQQPVSESGYSITNDQYGQYGQYGSGPIDQQSPNPPLYSYNNPSENTYTNGSGWYNNNNSGVKNDQDQTGNSAFSKNKFTENASSENEENHEKPPENSTNEKKEEENGEENKEDDKKGWFGRWFGKKESSGSNSKSANLGEENSFYFDPAGPDSTQTLTPPPPPLSRAKTTSPTPSSNLNPNRKSLPPIKTSNGSASTPPPFTGSRRSVSSASTRRPVRARYVDIMNQPPPSPK